MTTPQKTLSKPRLFKLALGGPLLLLSVALHGLVLSLPVPGWETTQKNSTEKIGNTSEPTSDIKVVELPTNAPLKAVPPVTTPKTPSAAPPKAAQPPLPTPSPQPAAPTLPKPQAKVQPAPSEEPPTSPKEPPEEAKEEPKPDPLPAEPPPPPTLEDRLRDPNAYAYNNQAKSSEMGTQDFTAWYNELVADAAYGDVIPGKAPEALSIQYPLNTCLPKEPEVGRLGVVVDAAGTVALQPKLLASTGYDVLDEQALASIAQYPFPATGMRMAYGVPIQVKYDAATCVPAAH